MQGQASGDADDDGAKQAGAGGKKTKAPSAKQKRILKARQAQAQQAPRLRKTEDQGPPEEQQAGNSFAGFGASHHPPTGMTSTSPSSKRPISRGSFRRQREAGFQSAIWVLMDSNQLWLSWLDCLLDILGVLPQLQARAATNGTPAWPSWLSVCAAASACVASKRTRLDTTDKDEKATRGDADLCTIRAIQVQFLTRQIWMVQKRRLAQLQAAMATTLARQAIGPR